MVLIPQLLETLTLISNEAPPTTLGLMDGGSAAVMTQGDPEALQVLNVRHQRGPAFTSSFETEAWALVMVVQWADQVVGVKRLFVCTDRFSVLPAFWAGDILKHTALDHIYDKLLAFRHQFIFQWVPGHLGVPGNKLADEEARFGLVWFGEALLVNG